MIVCLKLICDGEFLADVDEWRQSAVNPRDGRTVEKSDERRTENETVDQLLGIETRRTRARRLTQQRPIDLI
jgi:hypothetical protein